MRKLRASVWLMTFGLAMSGCASNGAAVRAECPQPVQVPASLMVEPQTETKVRAELLELPAKPTRR